MSSMFNKTKTESCPRSWDEYLEAASKLCPNIGGKFNYICVPNANKTELVQFCFERGKFPAWQLGKHCPYLHNTGNMNSENCKRFSYGCPIKHYKTRELYQFPACTQINKQSSCYSADPMCPPIRFAEATIMPKENITATRNNPNRIVLSVVLLAPILLIGLLVAVITLVLRRDRLCRKEESKDELLREPNDEPDAPLNDKEEKGDNGSAQLSDRKKNVIHKTKINELHVACRHGKLNKCRQIMYNYPNILNETDSKGWNAASYAAEGGNVAILELLAKNGVNLRHKNDSGSNILHIACFNSNLEMCHHIIEHYQEMLNEKDRKGWNAALYAAEGGNVAILELLAKTGVSLAHTNNSGSNIFHIACRNSKLEMCQHIINNYSDMLDKVDRRGWNDASNTAEGGNVDILELLVRNGVNLAHENRSGINILQIACFNSKIEMCQYIINHYSDMVNKVDRRGWNAASYAAQGGNVDVLKLLAKNGVDIRHENDSKFNILHIASFSSNLEMCKHIIEHYPDMLNQVNNEGENEAIQASQGGNIDVLKLLAKKGVNIRCKNNSGSNILHIACLKSKLEMCQHIIKHYPDIIYEVDKNGWNAAFSTAQGGSVKILELLAKNGVNLTLKSKFGSNILHIASRNSNLEMCKHIIEHYPDIIYEVDKNGWNAAHSTAQGGGITILELLAKNGVDLTHKTNLGNNILHIACRDSNLEMCKHIIKHYPDMLNQVNKKGENATLFAAQGQNVEVVDYLQRVVSISQRDKNCS